MEQNSVMLLEGNMGSDMRQTNDFLVTPLNLNSLNRFQWIMNAYSTLWWMVEFNLRSKPS